MRIVAIVCAVIVVVVGAIAFAPAALLDGRLRAATQDRLQLGDATGTIWQGRGRIIDARRSWSIPVNWTWDPLPLLHGEVAVALVSPPGSDLAKGTLRWRSGELRVDDLDLAIPAAMLSSAIPMAGAFVFGGDIAISTPHLSWSANAGDGRTTSTWTSARIVGAAGDVALGTVGIDVVSRDGRLIGRVGNRGGQVNVDGDFDFGAGGFQGNANVSPTPSTPPAIARALATFGSPDASGTVHWQWRTAAH